MSTPRQPQPRPARDEPDIPDARDEEEHPEISPSGHPIESEPHMDRLTPEDLAQGVDLTGDDTPEEAHAGDHPTPDRPSGRVGP
jgi:hypothetical protein